MFFSFIRYKKDNKATIADAINDDPILQSIIAGALLVFNLNNTTIILRHIPKIKINILINNSLLKNFIIIPQLENSNSLPKQTICYIKHHTKNITPLPYSAKIAQKPAKFAKNKAYQPDFGRM